jgi:hypothetical protein
MHDKELTDISKKLDVVARLLAFNIIKDKPVNEQIDMLTKAGLRASEIAGLLDKTENQIYVTQTKLRKKKVSAKEGQEIGEKQMGDDIA